MVKLWLEAGANVNHLVGEAKTHLIKYVSNEDTLAAILEFNPDLESKGTHSETVLVTRAQDWHNQVSTGFLRRLINAGADLEAKDRYSDTPLANAAIVGKMEFIELLISKRAKIDDTSTPRKFGGALHRACVFGELGSVKLLVDRGADISLHCTLRGSPL